MCNKQCYTWKDGVRVWNTECTPKAIKLDRDGNPEEMCYCSFISKYEGQGEAPFRKLITESQIFKPRGNDGKQRKLYVKSATGQQETGRCDEEVNDE